MSTRENLLVHVLAPGRCVLRTRLTPPECEARLRPCLAGWPMFRPTKEHQVSGSVSASGFALTKAIGFRNSFQTEARGTFLPERRGTRIPVTFGPSPLVWVFGLIWFLFVVALIAAAVPAWLSRQGPSNLVDVVIPVAVVLGGVLLFGVGRALARGEDVFLRRFLLETLEAEEVSAEPPR
jgi:hypothetical protein